MISLLDALIGPPVTTAEQQIAAEQLAWAMTMAAQAVEIREPGIHWHRVGGKEHVVLIVRPTSR